MAAARLIEQMRNRDGITSPFLEEAFSHLTSRSPEEFWTSGQYVLFSSLSNVGVLWIAAVCLSCVSLVFRCIMNPPPVPPPIFVAPWEHVGCRWMTEKTGGSDVGQSQTTATHVSGKYAVSSPRRCGGRKKCGCLWWLY